MAANYSASLNINQDSCLYAIKELQESALQKLKERDHFKTTGLATIKVRISNEERGMRILNFEIRLNATGLDLKNDIATRIDVNSDRFDKFFEKIVVFYYLFYIFQI